MKNLASAFLGLVLAASPVLTGGVAAADVDAGEKMFGKCKACHSIVADDDTVIFRGGKIGPNLYGVDGRVAGTVDGFRYGKSIVEAGEEGLVWNEETFSGYVADPKGFLVEALGTKSVQAKMAFKLTDAEDLADIWAYLVSVGPATN